MAAKSKKTAPKEKKKYKLRISNQKVKLKLEAQNLGNCLITLGLVKLNADGKHIQTKQRTITGSMEPKAPALCAVFEHVTLDLETQISECDNKISLIEGAMQNSKLSKSAADKHKESKRQDR
eukprot:1019369_1